VECRGDNALISQDYQGEPIYDGKTTRREMEAQISQGRGKGGRLKGGAVRRLAVTLLKREVEEGSKSEAVLVTLRKRGDGARNTSCHRVSKKDEGNWCISDGREKSAEGGRGTSQIHQHVLP